MNPASLFNNFLPVSFSIFIAGLVHVSTLDAEDTFKPFPSGNVAQDAVELWKDYDARKEPLNIRVVKQWKSDGIVTKYVTFTVGTFKSTESRIAAYYSYPDNGNKNAAFVWSHGGGQRADRQRGVYFARQGFATVDINWGGRPLEPDIVENTDWGRVDPTQGPRFYAKALRQGWKRPLTPDEHTIDPVVSPRNSNWFLLAVAARRAITFLEQQPEVDPNRIGFSGYSMGGMITALAAPDPRLKAVAPFVGGTGFKYVDFPGVEGSSLRGHFADHLDLYKYAIDPRGYWPQVKCPVVFISSSNDFHSAFDRIYRSMDLLQHDNWRVTTNVHENHGPGPEQWVMLNQWFDQHLKGIERAIPVTPPSTFVVDDRVATFTVHPEDRNRLVATEIYYSYDPNPRTRFWNRANPQQIPDGLRVQLDVHHDLPLYVFALCRYKLGRTQQLERGETDTFVLNSLEHAHLPKTVKLEALEKLSKPGLVFEDFRHGTVDWSSRDGRSIKTYKFQNPELDRGNDKKLAVTINPGGKRLALRLNAGSKFLGRGKDLGDFSFVKQISGDGAQVILVDRSQFKNRDDKQLEWSRIATFTVTIVDRQTNQTVRLIWPEGQQWLQRIELVD